MSQNLNFLLKDYPPVLIEKPRNCYLQYYSHGERKILKLNKLRKRLNDNDFRDTVNQIISTVKNQTTANQQEQCRIDGYLQKWIKEKSKELRPDTIRSYSSFVNIFGEWCRMQKLVYLDEIT